MIICYSSNRNLIHCTNTLRIFPQVEPSCACKHDQDAEPRAVQRTGDLVTRFYPACIKIAMIREVISTLEVCNLVYFQFQFIAIQTFVDLHFGRIFRGYKQYGNKQNMLPKFRLQGRLAQLCCLPHCITSNFKRRTGLS